MIVMDNILVITVALAGQVNSNHSCSYHLADIFENLLVLLHSYLVVCVCMLTTLKLFHSANISATSEIMP